MKVKIAVIALVVALVIVSSFASIATAESEEISGSNDTVFESPGDIEDGRGSGAEPMGGDERGGPNPM